MRQLNRSAQAYILSTILVGSTLLVWDLVHYQVQGTWMTLVSCGLASLALIFKVEGSTNRSHYNFSFLIYAFTLVALGPEKLVLVILVSNLAEWVRFRYPWYIPIFNAFSLTMVFSLAGVVLAQVPSFIPQTELSGVAAILLALAVATVANHLLIGLVIWFAHRENFIQSGLLEFFPLMFDFTLMSLGAGTALLWRLNPFAIVLAVLPLYLIYSTSKMPALERKTETDPKTGVYNAGYFNNAIENELKRSKKFERPLTVVMADLDLLRNINNTYGHLAGDEVLIGVANILKNSAREYDVVARFGGEEFVILMPETVADDVLEHVEMIRRSIEQAEFNVQTSVTPIKATMSFGIAGRLGPDQTAKQLLHNADTALYHAKLKGRNRAYIYTESDYQALFKSADCLPACAPVEASAPYMAVPPSEQEIVAGQPVEIPLPPEDVSPASCNPPAQAAAPASAVRPAGHALTTRQYVAILVVVALALFGVMMPFSALPNGLSLALFAGMVAWTEWLSIDIYVRETSVSTSAVPMLAGFLLFGPVGVAVLSLTLATVAMVKHRSRPRSFFFNTSNQMIAGLLCAGGVRLAGNSFTGLDLWQQFLAGLIASGMIYTSTTWLIAVGMHLDLDASIGALWKEKFSWLAPYYLLMGGIAFVLVFCFTAFGPPGILVVLGPLMLLRFGQIQYLSKTRAMVQELREKNLALEKSAEEIGKLNEGLLNALAEVVDLRDPYVLGHSKQVARIAELLARKMGLSHRQAMLIHKAGLLHDIGKLGIPETILSKPGKLDQQEFTIMKRHTTVGAEILKSSYSLHDLIPVIYHHHEHYDGGGYPGGLKGSETSIEARIVAVADAVDAMAFDRPYQRGRKLGEIVAELKRCSGTQFDPQVVEAFIALAGDMGEALIAGQMERVEIQVER